MQVGDTIDGRYRLERELGRGGLGVVWAATTSVGSRVAIKFLHDSDGLGGTSAQRFEVEARAMARLDAPGCVQFHEFGVSKGAPFIVMELVDGVALFELTGSARPWRWVADVGAQIADALAHAHACGIVHRDLKPQNIMVVGDPLAPEIKVLDFGLAKLTGRIHPDITKTGEVFGTPMYMSPEQLRGRKSISSATDLYALGLILFEFLEGHRPFDGDSLIEIAKKHLSEEAPPVRAECPERFRRLVTRMLNKDSGLRPTDASSVARELRSFDRSGRTNALAVAGLALIGILAVIGFALVVGEGGRGADAPVPHAPTRPTAKSPPPALELSSSDAGLAANVPHTTEGADAGADGCGAPAKIGRRSFRISDVGSFINGFDVYLPPSYDARKKHALVVLLPAKSQRMWEDTRFDEVAREEGFILLMPSNPFVHVYMWDSLVDVEALREGLTTAKARYCIDADRIFAVGHVSGGDVAESAPCAIEEFDAIATMSTRAKPSQTMCDRAIPYLHLAPLKDGYNPIEGGESCSGIQKVSLADHEELLRVRNGCTAKRRTVSKHGASTCYSWNCETPLVSCHLDGGHNWPFAGRRAADLLNQCDGTPAKFPFREKIWEFFAER